MMKQPSVGIIIVNWNGRTYTHDCLLSLRKLNYPNYKIFLVDNGSTDGSVTFFRDQHPNIEIVALQKNTGFTGGNNAGMRKALKEQFDYVLLLNNDTVCNEADFLSKMIQPCGEDPKVGMACPTIYYDKPTGRVWYAGAKLSLWSGWKHYYTKPQTNDIQLTGYTTGCCLLVKTKTIRDIGLLNNAYFLSVEDVEWSMRAKENGWKTIYVSEPTIIHKDSISSKSKGEGFFSPTRVYYGFRNSIWFIREYANPLQKMGLWPVRFFVNYLYKACAYIILGRKGKLRAISRGFAEGIFAKSSTFKSTLRDE